MNGAANHAHDKIPLSIVTQSIRTGRTFDGYLMPCRFFIDVHIAEHRPVLGFAFPVLHAAAINFSRIRLGKCFTVHPADAVGERVNIEPLGLQMRPIACAAAMISPS
jgi:hypothetical protein